MSPPLTSTTVARLGDSWVKCPTGKSPPPPGAPAASVPQSCLQMLGELPRSSSHTVNKMDFSGGVVYFKHCDKNYPPILAQLEAAASASYRLARGQASAEVRPVIDAAGKVVGAISLELPGFEPLFNITYTVENLLDWNVSSELVARYVREEDDEHDGNLGVCLNSFIGGLDYDMSYYSLTAAIKGARIISRVLAPRPEKAFPITARDLQNFPILIDQQPCHWPTKTPNNKNYSKEYKGKKVFCELSENPRFIEQKWFSFLVELMIDRQTHQKAMEKYFSQDYEAIELLNNVCQLHEKRLVLIQELLVQNDSFRKFIIQDKRRLEALKEHFQKTANFMNPSEFATFMVRCKNRFERLVCQCMAKDLTLVIFDAGHYLESNSSKEIYSVLVNLLARFVQDPSDLSGAFDKLEMGHTELVRRYSHVRQLIPERFIQVMENYRGFIRLNSFGVEQSLYMEAMQDITAYKPKEFDKAHAIAKSVGDWLRKRENNFTCREIIQKTMDDYRPVLTTYFRRRTPELEEIYALFCNCDLSEEEKLQALLQFFSNGAWNLPGKLCYASANVILLEKLVETVLKEFKSGLSPDMLKNHELVQICYLVHNGKLKIQELLQNIFQALKSC